MDPLIGQIVLVVYAVLLIGGGIAGFATAGSQRSLFAGIASGVLAAAFALVARLGSGRLGFVLGAVLALGLVAFFGKRFLESRKFMPGGMMAIVSLVTVVFLIFGAVAAK